MWQYIEKSGIVVDRPCVLLQAIPAPTAGQTKFDWAIYNGKNTGGDVIWLGEGRYTDSGLTFPTGIECSEGLYVTVGTNLNGVLVIWRHDDPQETEWQKVVSE